MLPISQMTLPQCLLGSEAQLAAFAAALPPQAAARCVFAPLPEMFGDPRSLAQAWAGCGMTPPAAGDVLHLRFGSVRMARVLKGVRNAAVVAEAVREQPLATSGHPFASGLHLPAAMERIFAYAPLKVPPVRVDGFVLPVELLPACLDADLAAVRRARRTSPAGLDMVSFAAFDSAAWAAGPVAGVPPASDTPLVLLPWNLDHPGSIVPDLLARLVRVQNPAAPRVRMMVLPFNYLGQTGLIRRLIAHVAAAGGRAALAYVMIGRLTTLKSLPALRALSRTAWVEAGDPEHDWTMARLRAAGFSPVTLDGGEDRIWVEVDTRYGTLAYHPHIPSLREIASLLDRTAAR